MLEDVKQFTDFLVKWKITPNQFFLCWLLFWDHKEYKGGKRPNPNDPLTFANVYRYAKKVKNWNVDEINDLVEKGLIENPSGKQMKIDQMKVTQKFIDELLVNKKREDEFWDAYPTWIKNFHNPSKPQINLKTCVESDIKTLYRKFVKTKKKHERVMEILKWAKRHDKIRCNIENFVKSKMWEQLEELMEQEGHGGETQFGTKTAF